MVIAGKKKGEYTFVFNAPKGAKEVYLAGSFNNWGSQGKKMSKWKDGSFRTKVQLAAGRHEYKFIVDGTWMADPEAACQALNIYGTSNSILEVE